MADTIDVTIERDRIKFVPVSASSVSFQVLGFGSARLSFVTSTNIWDDSNIVFEITLGNQSFIQRLRDVDIYYPNMVPETFGTTWTSFWATWHRGCVRVGLGGDDEPFMERSFKGTADLEKVKYVFPSMRHGEWKFDVGPILPESRCYSVTGGEPVWVPVGESLPIGSVIGGYENEPLHIIRAKHRGSITPGKFVPSEGTAYIPWGGGSHEKEEFEALVGYNFDWVATSGRVIPPGAIPAGKSETNDETLFIGRAEIDGHLVPGKVQPSHQVMYIPYDGKEISKRNYEILAIPVPRDPRIVIQKRISSPERAIVAD